MLQIIKLKNADQFTFKFLDRIYIHYGFWKDGKHYNCSKDHVDAKTEYHAIVYGGKNCEDKKITIIPLTKAVISKIVDWMDEFKMNPENIKAPFFTLNVIGEGQKRRYQFVSNLDLMTEDLYYQLTTDLPDLKDYHLFK